MLSNGTVNCPTKSSWFSPKSRSITLKRTSASSGNLTRNWNVSFQTGLKPEIDRNWFEWVLNVKLWPLNFNLQVKPPELWPHHYHWQVWSWLGACPQAHQPSGSQRRDRWSPQSCSLPLAWADAAHWSPGRRLQPLCMACKCLAVWAS